MLPRNNIINTLNQKMPSYTYNINIESGRIIGHTDHLNAMEQAIYLILSTERYESIIYNWYYGVEFDSLIGKNRDYTTSELKRRIREALSEDDRISDVTDFNISYKEDAAHVSFLVQTNIGDIDINWEVNI